MKSVIHVAIFIFFTLRVFSQMPGDDCGCNAALSPNLMTVIQTYDNRSQQEYVVSYLNSMSYDEFDKETSGETKVGIDAIVKSIPIGIDFSKTNSSAEYSNNIKQLSNYLYSDNRSFSLNKSYLRVFNEELTKQWLECKKICIRQKQKNSGLIYYAELSEVSGTFEIHLLYTGGYPGQQRTHISVLSDVDLVNCTPLGTRVIKQGTKVPHTVNETVYLFKIYDRKKSARVAFDVEFEGTVNIEVLPIRPKKVPTPITDPCDPRYQPASKDLIGMSFQNYFYRYVKDQDNLVGRPWYILDVKYSSGSAQYLMLITASQTWNPGRHLNGFWMNREDFIRFFGFATCPENVCPEKPAIALFINKADYKAAPYDDQIRVGWLKNKGSQIYGKVEPLGNYGMTSTKGLPGAKNLKDATVRCYQGY